MSLIGKHNMENLAAAAEVCALCGVGEEEFFQSMQYYQGAHLRQDVVLDRPNLRVYRDYAHAPSKVRATLSAVRELFPKSHITAVVELHTFSSLDPEYLQSYAGTLDEADKAVVLVDSETIARKRREPLQASLVHGAFRRKDLIYVQSAKALLNAVHEEMGDQHRVVLLMSSGNFAGADFDFL
jgi:UDP-N-acetylmuramate: L-alanyl-gamma-D-glutamyl-meso-diaminopimelate ligase